MPRIKIPHVLKTTLNDGETPVRMYRRDKKRNWVPCGWVVIDDVGGTLYTITDEQIKQNESCLIHTQPKEKGTV